MDQKAGLGISFKVLGHDDIMTVADGEQKRREKFIFTGLKA